MGEEKACGLLIKQINDALEKNANNALRAKDLTFTQIGMLTILDESSERQLTLKELEKKLQVAQPTVVGIVSRLRQKGFVDTLGDQADRRIRRVILTEKGEELCAFAWEQMRQAEEGLLKNLSQPERKEFLRLLEMVRDGL